MLWGAAVGSDHVCGKGHAKCSPELRRRVLPSLFLARQGQPWVQLLASQSRLCSLQQKEKFTPVSLKWGEEAAALLLLLGPGRVPLCEG